MPQIRYRVQITAITTGRTTATQAEAAADPALFGDASEEVFRQTFDELNVPAVIAFLNRARRVRRKAASS